MGSLRAKMANRARSKRIIAAEISSMLEGVKDQLDSSCGKTAIKNVQVLVLMGGGPTPALEAEIMTEADVMGGFGEGRDGEGL